MCDVNYDIKQLQFCVNYIPTVVKVCFKYSIMSHWMQKVLKVKPNYHDYGEPD